MKRPLHASNVTKNFMSFTVESITAGIVGKSSAICNYRLIQLFGVFAIRNGPRGALESNQNV